MKFVSVRDLRTTPAQVWKSLPEEQELVLTNHGKPIALITPLGESDLEDTLSAIRKARAEKAIQNMQLSSMQNNISQMSMEELNIEISESRKARKK